MGGAHPFVSGCPQLSIIRPSSQGALDPKKQCSGNPRASRSEEGRGSRVTVLAGWRRAGVGAASTPELGHVWKQNLSQYFSPFHPTGPLPEGRSVAHTAACPNSSSPGSPRVSQFRPTPDAAQTTLGFASHGSGEMRAGHLTPLCACPWLWVALLRGWRLGIPLPLEKGQALHLVQAGCWG